MGNGSPHFKWVVRTGLSGEDDLTGRDSHRWRQEEAQGHLQEQEMSQPCGGRGPV